MSALTAPNRLPSLILRFSPGVLVPAAVSVGIAAIFTRVLSTESYGRYSLAVALSALAVSLTAQWLQQGALRYIPARQSEQAADVARDAVVSAAFVISLVALLIGLPAHWLSQRLVGPQWYPLLLPTLLIWCLGVVSAVLYAVMQAGFEAGRHSILRALGAVVRFALALGLVLGLGMHEDGLLWALALATATVVPLLLKGVGLRMGHVTRVTVSPEVRRMLGTIARYGLPLTGWFAASQLLYAGDRYIIQIFRGSAEVGVYSASYDLVAGAVQLVSAPLLLAMHPLLMRSLAASGRQGAEDQLAKIVRWFALPGMALACTVWLFGAEVVRMLLGPAFSEGASIAPLVFLGFLAWQLGFYLQKPIEVAERTGTLFAIAAAAAVLNLVLNAALVPGLGFRAAAVNTLMAYSFYVFTVVAYLKRGLGIRIAMSTSMLWALAVVGVYILIGLVTAALRTVWGSAVAMAVGLTACAAVLALAGLAALRRGRLASE